MQLPYSEAELTCGTAFYTNLPEGVEVTNYQGGNEPIGKVLSIDEDFLFFKPIPSVRFEVVQWHIWVHTLCGMWNEMR